MDHVNLCLTVMSGVDDGTLYKVASHRGDGLLNTDSWTVTIGRLETCDIRINSDSYISRHHASLHWRDNVWWLEDCKSRNGTFTIDTRDFFEDKRVNGIIPIGIGQLFRIGRTWVCIEISD